MFNLLPEQEKKQIIGEYRARRTIVGLFFLFIVGLMSIIAIFPSFVLSGSRISGVETSLNNMKNSPIFKEEATLSSKLSEANLKLVALRPPKRDVDVSALFQAIVSRKKSTIRLTSFTYISAVGTTPGKVSISGIAKSREDLSAFVEDLKKIPEFKSVNLPVSSFTKDSNADFSIELTGDF